MRTRESTLERARPRRSSAGRARPASVFAALGDAMRLALITRLGASGPQSVTGLTRRAGVTRQAVTKHLEVLERAGLVRGRKHGREKIWQVDPTRLDETRRYLETIAAQWDTALARLKHFVEQ